ncbi:MAG: 2-oxoacid:acceptor oxidoreductase family protein [Lachnospiraceae bacterium]|jgi:2-oxoglutarate ferredoxin oxidoreductase subunit gamma
MKQIGIRLAGSGGQGIILCSIILADAALMGGSYVAQSQSYGPEARGGTCKAETLISDVPIDFPKVEQSDFMMALTQAALEKYLPFAKPGSIVMIDDSLTMPAKSEGYKVYSAPIIATARDVLKKPMVANIVACGYINACLKLIDAETLEAAVLKNVPKGTEELNHIAMIEGIRLFEE